MSQSGHRSTANADQFEKPVVVVYYNVDYEKDPKGTNYWRNRVLKVAEKFAKGKKGDAPTVTFAVSNAHDFTSELQEFGLESPAAGDKGAKPLVGARNEKNQKFPMKGEFTYLTLSQFISAPTLSSSLSHFAL